MYLMLDIPPSPLYKVMIHICFTTKSQVYKTGTCVYSSVMYRDVWQVHVQKAIDLISFQTGILSVNWSKCVKNTGKVKSAFRPSGPSGQNVSWFLQHLGTRSTHLYTWVDSGTTGVKCLAQEHNTLNLARAQTQTT